MRHRLTGLAVAALVLLTGACGTTAASPPHPKAAAPYVAQMKQVLATHPQAFVKQAFADYYVSAEEKNQAQQLFTQCMANQGYQVSGWGNGGQYTVAASPGNPHPNDTNAENQARDSCDKGLMQVVYIYGDERSNPRGLTGTQLVRDCYRKHHVPDGENLSDAEFEKLTTMSNWANYMPSSPAAALCLLDPDGSNGYTADQAMKTIQGIRQTAQTPSTTTSN